MNSQNIYILNANAENVPKFYERKNGANFLARASFGSLCIFSKHEIKRNINRHSATISESFKFTSKLALEELR